MARFDGEGVNIVDDSFGCGCCPATDNKLTITMHYNCTLGQSWAYGYIDDEGNYRETLNAFNDLDCIEYTISPFGPQVEPLPELVIEEAEGEGCGEGSGLGGGSFGIEELKSAAEEAMEEIGEAEQVIASGYEADWPAWADEGVSVTTDSGAVSQLDSSLMPISLKGCKISFSKTGPPKRVKITFDVVTIPLNDEDEGEATTESYEMVMLPGDDATADEDEVEITPPSVSGDRLIQNLKIIVDYVEEEGEGE